ncbi:hypothetical protein DFQ28_000997 [Apophysomyces sp. BC1034]|nr:hypothetical protein DFQ28_000997 [Apophysomyces sp. BC1034]
MGSTRECHFQTLLGWRRKPVLVSVARQVTLATWQQEFRDKNNPIMSAELSGMTLEDEDITAPHESSSIDPFAESPRSPSPIHTTIPQPSFSSQPVEENPSDDEQPLFTATPEPSTAQDARARAAASRAAALEKLAARRRQKEEQQRQIHTQHEDEDMFEDDPGAEYLDDM